MPFRTTCSLLVAMATLSSCTDRPKAATPPAAKAAAPAAALGHSAAATMRYAGEYEWQDAGNKEMGGTLTVYPESDSTILFSLQANGGGPAYNMASAFGRAAASLHP